MAVPQTKTQIAVIVIVAVHVTAGVMIGRAACVSSVTLSSRHGLRAALLLPGDLRAFPVEKYAMPYEAFEYTMSTVRNGLTRWRLRIDTTHERRENWKHLLADHLRARNFRNVGTPWSGGGRVSRFSASGRCFVRLYVQYGPARQLHVTFEYWPNLGSGRPKQPAALMCYYVLKIKRALLGDNAIVNTITCPT